MLPLTSYIIIAIGLAKYSLWCVSQAMMCKVLELCNDGNAFFNPNPCAVCIDRMTLPRLQHSTVHHSIQIQHAFPTVYLLGKVSVWHINQFLEYPLSMLNIVYDTKFT